MNSHKNARTTYEGRELLIERIAVMGLNRAAQAAGISAHGTQWKLRFEADGDAGLFDLSSKPHRTRTTLDDTLLARIDRRRRDRRPMRTIASVVGRGVATISCLLKRLGLSSLKALDPRVDVVRYERAAPGEPLHRKYQDTRTCRSTEPPPPHHGATAVRIDTVSRVQDFAPGEKPLRVAAEPSFPSPAPR